MGLKSPEDVARGGGSGASCFPLDTGGVEAYLASGEGCLEI
jgi:hypothetical protein